MFENQTVLDAKRIGVLSSHKGDSLGQAARFMVSEDISALVVVNDEGCLAGIITRTDLLRAVVHVENWQEHTIEEFMNPQVVTVGVDANLQEVVQLLLDNQIHRVVVVRDQEGKCHPVSIVSAADLVYHMVKDIDNE